MRRLLLAALGLWVFVPATASAQDSPLYNCNPQTFRLTHTGPLLGTNKAGQVSGAVELICDDTTVFADEMKWDEKTVHARGSLLIVQEGLRVTADSADMDRASRLGTFYKAAGTARITDQPVQGSQFGTLEPEVSFYAEKIERMGPRTYRMTNGWFSTCLQANPRWDIRGSSGTITLDDHVLLRNAFLRVKGIPVIYLPLMYYPLGEDDRNTGFLIPTYSTSTIKGQGISNAFFWAMSRWQDLTLYHDYTSRAGQGAGAEYRFISSPGSRGQSKFWMQDEPSRFASDGTLERAGRRSYSVNGWLNQRVGRRFQAFGKADYFTDISTVQLYQQNVYEASRRNRTIQGNMQGRVGRYSLTARAERTDFYFNTTTAQRRGVLPQIRFDRTDQPIGRSKIYFGVRTELVGFQNQADINQPSTNRSLWRYDALQTMRAPLSSLSFLSATVSSSLRLTHWTDSLNAITGSPESVPITRPVAEISADVAGPVVARIFRTPNNGYAEGFKHSIEPRVVMKWLSPFDHINNVINNDPGVDCLVGGNTMVTYSLTNRLLAKRKAAGGRNQDIFTTSISQTYYSREAAGACDTQYETSAAGRYSAVQISASATPTDSMQGRFVMFIDSRTRHPQSYSASMSAFGSKSQVSVIWTKRQYLPDVPGYDNEAFANHSFTGFGSWHAKDRRFGTNAGFKLDVKQKQFLERSFSAFYNAQCCGVSVDYQIVNISPFGVSLQTDHRFNFSFTLAGIGSFSNPLGSFGR